MNHKMMKRLCDFTPQSSEINMVTGVASEILGKQKAGGGFPARPGIQSKGYDFYIDGMLLPITPAKVMTKIGNKNNVVTLLNGEELNLLKKPALTEFEFDMRLPSDDFPAVKQFLKPQMVLDKLEDLKKEKKAFQFIIIRTPYEPNLNNSMNKKVTLESYDIDEDEENGADLIISVRLKQYIPLKTKVVNVNADGKGKGDKLPNFAIEADIELDMSSAIFKDGAKQKAPKKR